MQTLLLRLLGEYYVASNSTLITTADSVFLASDGDQDDIFNTPGATAFIIDSAGATGDDTIKDFGKNDSILTTKKIFDGNNDGIIDFGKNGVLDVDRTSAQNAGADQITVEGLDGNALRYLGSKDGYFAYADASVRLAGFTEGTVNNDTLSGLGGAKSFFFDNALGLNLGKDTVNNFGADDKLVFTSALFDSDNNGVIEFGTNSILDVSGENGPAPTDPSQNPGGQVDVNGLGGNVTAIELLSTENVGGVDYFHYGLLTA